MRIAKTSFVIPLPRRFGAGVMSGLSLIFQPFFMFCTRSSLTARYPCAFFDSNCNAAFSGRSNCTTKMEEIALGGSQAGKVSHCDIPLSITYSLRVYFWAGFLQTGFLTGLGLMVILDLDYTVSGATARSKTIPYTTFINTTSYLSTSIVLLPFCDAAFGGDFPHFLQPEALVFCPCPYHMACETLPGGLYLTSVSGHPRLITPGYFQQAHIPTYHTLQHTHFPINTAPRVARTPKPTPCAVPCAPIRLRAVVITSKEYRPLANGRLPIHHDFAIGGCCAFCLLLASTQGGAYDYSSHQPYALATACMERCVEEAWRSFN